MFHSVHYKFLKKTCFATQDPMYSTNLDFLSHPKILPLGKMIEPATITALANIVNQLLPLLYVGKYRSNKQLNGLNQVQVPITMTLRITLLATKITTKITLIIPKPQLSTKHLLGVLITTDCWQTSLNSRLS